MRKSIVFGLALLLFSGAGRAVADTTFDTTSSWNGGSSIQPWGYPNTSTYGQTFVAPTDNVMKNFTFYVEASSGIHLQFKEQVYAWSGSMTGGSGPQGAVGPALWSSSSIGYDGNGSFQAITATISGGLTLTAGNHYVALFTISDPTDYANSNGTAIWGDTQGSHVANSGGGGFNFYNNGNNYGALNNGNWDDFADFGDSAWKANFSAASAVPEPASVTLLAVGAFGLLGYGWRRRKTALATPAC